MLVNINTNGIAILAAILKTIKSIPAKNIGEKAKIGKNISFIKSIFIKFYYFKNTLFIIKLLSTI